MKEIAEIVNTLNEAKSAYYEGKPLFSDDEFDELETKLKQIDPTNEYFERVGYNVDDIETVELKIPMLSMQKLTHGASIVSWYKNCGIPDDEEVIVEPKYDGISGELRYDKDGNLTMGVTRGDGRRGRTIPLISRYIAGNITNVNIPKKILNIFNCDIFIRGEFYIPKKFGKTIYKDKPLRNVCAGAIKTCENPETIMFAAYNVIVDTHFNPHSKTKNYILNTEEDSIKYLHSLGFEKVPYKICKSPKAVEHAMEEYITHGRDEYHFETDGKVVSVNCKIKQDIINSSRTVRSFNFFNIAIKPPAKSTITRALSLEINVSKSGRQIPVLIIEPVTIDNVTIDRATLNNYQFFKDFGEIHVGDIVTIKRANDVIPNVVSIEKCTNPGELISFDDKHCASCNHSLVKDGRHMVCHNASCQGKIISNIYNWVTKMNMKNIGIKFLEDTYDYGIIHSIPDLYKPELKNEISLMEGYVEGGGKIQKILEAIELSKKNVTDIDILTAVGIPGIGRSVLENIELFNIDEIDSVINSEPRSSLAICGYIRDWLDFNGNRTMLIILRDILNSNPTSTTKAEFIGNVVLTGTFDTSRDIISEKLKSKGFHVKSKVNSGTLYVFVGDDGVGTSKYNDAVALGVPIVETTEYSRILEWTIN